MSAYSVLTNYVKCDQPGCPAELHAESTIHALRREARRRGWLYTTIRHRRLDLCPDHKHLT